jgi:hypothetical protein
MSARGWSAAVLCSVLATSFVPAVDPPDAEVNPKSGLVEVCDSFLGTGVYRVRHTIKEAQGGTEEVVLSDGTADDIGPRIAIQPEGHSWVVWWRDAATDSILYRIKDYETGTWSSAALVSAAGQSSRNPEIVHASPKTFVAYEASAGSATAIAVAITDDGAEPFPQADILATTTFAGDEDVHIDAESGHVWVTWVHSASDVGWSEYDPQTDSWGSPQWESYESSSVKEAREEIREIVLE